MGEVNIPSVMPEPPTELGPETFLGARCGRYRLCFEIGSGGMATVFLARIEGHAGFGKLVALKRIHPYLAKERQFVEMFLDEVRIASLLTHPNLCGVYDFDETDGSHFFTMEYLVGEPLVRLERRLIAARDRIAPEARVALACRIVADAAEGLHSAHELVDLEGNPLRVVHRDVSPSNIVVTYDGSVRVVDFGIAHAASRLHQTAVGFVKGKFAYMAPEQFLGGAIDRRLDVWGLGVLLYELLAGERLFRRETDWHTMHAILHDDVPKLASVVPEVTDELDRILARALERDVDRRYPTTRELSHDLLRYLARAGYVCGLAEVAERMNELFPEGQVKHRRLMSLAARLDPRRDSTPGVDSSLLVADEAPASVAPASIPPADTRPPAAPPPIPPADTRPPAAPPPIPPAATIPPAVPAPIALADDEDRPSAPITPIALEDARTSARSSAITPEPSHLPAPWSEIMQEDEDAPTSLAKTPDPLEAVLPADRTSCSSGLDCDERGSRPGARLDPRGAGTEADARLGPRDAARDGRRDAAPRCVGWRVGSPTALAGGPYRSDPAPSARCREGIRSACTGHADADLVACRRGRQPRARRHRRRARRRGESSAPATPRARNGGNPRGAYEREHASCQSASRRPLHRPLRAPCRPSTRRDTASRSVGFSVA